MLSQPVMNASKVRSCHTFFRFGIVADANVGQSILVPSRAIPTASTILISASVADPQL